jgi:tetraacyldisaccharide 4'-kinase
MRAPGFWSHGKGGVIAPMLAPLGWIYGLITAIRMKSLGFRVSAPVISIGNFTAGGAGKTPTALAVADRLAKDGERPFILTRGYGGSEKGPLRVDPARHDVSQIGDEALMMARYCPVIVARDRKAGADLAIASGATCLILDDAMQNPRLIKDISIAVIDGGFGFGNGFVIPAGPLRGSLARSAEHITDLLLVGSDETLACAALPSSLPVHTAEIVADEAAVAALRGQRVVAFCGIGRPEKFYASLRAAGAEIVTTRDFPDHHAFTASEITALIALAQHENAALATTEKDRVRLYIHDKLLAGVIILHVLPVRFSLAESLHQRIAAGLAEAREKLANG